MTPDVRAPEGSRVSEVSDEGVRLGVSSSEVSVKHNCVGRLTPSHNLGALGAPSGKSLARLKPSSS